jgi:sugar transferase (PEP-CTERM/EpsH1 system associated)
MSDPQGDSAHYQRMRRVYARFATHYVALSKDIQAYLQHRIGLPGERIYQIYNGVDTRHYRARAGAPSLPEGMPFSRDAWLVGTVGRLEAVKDQPTLAYAFVAATRGSPDAARRLRLVIVGDGPARQEIMRILEAGGVAERAWLAGERADVAQIMRSLDCFVLPSRSEGVSNTLLEAMASGLPVIATRVGGNGELIEHGVSGTLVRAMDVAGIAAAMLDYFHDRAKAHQHAAAARARAEQHFGLERMVAAYDRLYATTLGARLPDRHFASARLAQAVDHHSESD